MEGVNRLSGHQVDVNQVGLRTLLISIVWLLQLERRRFDPDSAAEHGMPPNSEKEISK